MYIFLKNLLIKSSFISIIYNHIQNYKLNNYLLYLNYSYNIYMYFKKQYIENLNKGNLYHKECIIDYYYIIHTYLYNFNWKNNSYNHLYKVKIGYLKQNILNHIININNLYYIICNFLVISSNLYNIDIYYYLNCIMNLNKYILSNK